MVFSRPAMSKMLRGGGDAVLQVLDALFQFLHGPPNLDGYCP